jgi:NTE family protein
MSSSLLEPPKTLVLGVGGVLGEAWMTGMLAGISSGTDIDFRECEHVIGTSAGSIVAAHLAAGEEPRSPRDKLGTTRDSVAGGAGAGGSRDFRGASAASESSLDMPAPAGSPALEDQPNGSPLAAIARRAASAGMAVGAPLVPFALAAAAPGGALARAALLARSPSGRFDLDGLGERIDDLGARFDGQLRVVAVDRASGRRVVFGEPASPDATVGEAVEASCAVPGIFRPITIGARTYVDGGVWSPTNLDLVSALRGDQVLCLTPTGGVGAVRSLTFPWRAVSRSATTIELAVSRRRGASVRVIAPDRDSARAMGEDLMNPRRSDRALAAGYRQGQAIYRSTGG